MEDTDATQLMLEALFDVRGMVSDLHSLHFENGDPDDGEEEEEDA